MENAEGLPVDYRPLSQWERRNVRLRYIDLQDGLCHHCGGSLEVNPPPNITGKHIDWRRFPGGINFLRHPIHLHHNHKTGMTIGAVHAYCNAVLWQYHGE